MTILCMLLGSSASVIDLKPTSDPRQLSLSDLNFCPSPASNSVAENTLRQSIPPPLSSYEMSVTYSEIREDLS